jgi:ABC-2 type transport system permease protein
MSRQAKSHEDMTALSSTGITRTIAGMTVRQVLGLRRFILLGLLALAPAVVLFFAAARTNDAGRTEAFVGIVSGMYFSLVVPITALVLASSSLGEERREETLSFLVLRPVSRSRIAVAKVLGAFAAASAVVGLGAVAVNVVMALRGGGFEWLLPVLVGGLVGTAAYVGLFVPLGYAFEKATLIGLAYVFIWETAVVGTLPGLSATSPWRIGLSAFAGLAPVEFEAVVGDFSPSNVAAGAGGATLKALAIVAIGTAVTTWLLARRDNV